MLIINDDPQRNRETLEKEFIKLMKEQERQAIKSLITAKKATILSKGKELAKSLQDEANNMKNYASNDYVQNIQYGFEAKAADAATTYLTQTLQKPSLNSPIQDGESPAAAVLGIGGLMFE